MDADGVQSNEWNEITWDELKELFAKEFGADRTTEIFKCNQKSSESGLTFSHRMTKMHAQSSLGSNEPHLAIIYSAAFDILNN